MKIKHERSLLLPDNSNPTATNKIECCAWSPNGQKLAVCTASNNQVALFNAQTYERKEKFALKATGKNFSRKSFVVKGLAFSPDSTRLAVGQTDCVIFAYKIGGNWGDKKSIVGKYTLQSPLTCMEWHDSGIVFGSSDGKIKIIQTATNRMGNLISTNSMAISLSIAGDSVLAGFLNGAVIIAAIGGRDAGRQLITHSCPPFALALSHSGYACFGGCDGRLLFLNTVSNISNSSSSEGRQTIELGTDIGHATASPSGNIVIVSTLEKLIIFQLEGQYWRQNQVIELQGTYLISSLFWSQDGTKLVAGSVNGALELFTFQWKRKLIGNNHEINYVGANQVVIKDVSNNIGGVFRASAEIKDVRLVRERFAVIWTKHSLLVGDVQNSTTKLSEIDWQGRTQAGVKFCFDYEGVVLVNVVGELYLIELGNNQLLASVRTDFVNPHLMSVRVKERKSDAKVLAYLLDLRTICVVDLLSSIQLCTWSHDDRIDWLELNETGRLLLFRDRTLRLYLLNIGDQESQVMLNVCGFVQWVPNSDVIVAQSGDKLYVWYDLSKPTIYEVMGGSRVEAKGIEREGGLTRVTFSTGSNNDIILDEVMLEFDTALHDGDLERAMSFLESVDLSAESESMWRQLGKVALQKRDLIIAERSYAAVADVSRATFIQESSGNPGRIALLENDWATFEASVDFDTVSETYIKLHKWDKAIDMAARTGRSEMQEDLERRYYDYLLQSQQEVEAGRLMERSGQIEEAIKLYLKSGHAVQAARVITDIRNRNNIGRSQIENTITELIHGQFYEEAADLYVLPAMANHSKALDNYLKGNAYPKAIDLARREFPEEVVKLEAKFGEYLMLEARDPAAAVGHLIEAGRTDRALEAAIQAGQFERAAEISSIMENVPTHYGRQIGDYYASKSLLDPAVEMYLNSGCIREALLLLNRHGQYNRAYKMARKLLDADEANEMFASIAGQLQDDGKHKEAERIYLICNDVDSAISMYKSAKQYEHMIRLVKQYHPDLLSETHMHLAKELETESQLHQAELHYVAAGDEGWRQAVTMYKNDNQWEEAYRVARSHGGTTAAKQVAFLWAKSLPDLTGAVKLLSRFGLLHQVVDYAIEIGSFDFGRDLAQAAGPELRHKVTKVRMKQAAIYEDQGRLEEAEHLFIEAGRPREAVVMYLHKGAFGEAQRVAEEFVKDENVISEVLVAQAKAILEKSRSAENIGRAETLLLRAGRIELAIDLYKSERMYEDAFRICEQYAPNLLDSLRREVLAQSRSGLDMDAFSAVTRVSSRRGSEVDRMSLHSRSSRRTFDVGDDSDDERDAGTAKDIRSQLERADKSGDRERAVKIALQAATQMIKEKNPVEALKILIGHPGVFLLSDSKRVVLRIANELFSLDNDVHNTLSVWKSLRDALYQLSLSQTDQAEFELVERSLLVSHYLLLRTVLKSLSGQNGARELELKLVVSLLRYTDLVRVDRLFYEAGMMSKESDRLEMAFVFWNHFLDLIEAIEEGELNVDHSDFDGTDIPAEVPLPSQPFYVELGMASVVEEVKNWILQVSMDTQVSQSLPVCAFREGNVYEASLINRDQTVSLPCLISGYPVLKHKMLELKPGRFAANKDDFNKLLMLAKVTASDDLKEILLFIGKLCGNSAVARFSFQ